MSEKDFIIKKLFLMSKDKQEGFKDFVGPLQEMAESNTRSNKVKIQADGSWFKMSFDAVQVKENRLVISARRIEDGLLNSTFDPTIKEFRVQFEGTRAAYIRGHYEPRHPLYGWSFIHWDVRSYANDPSNKNTRIYVRGFRANNEITRLILAMEGLYGTKNILNSYVSDNYNRFKTGLNSNKTPEQIEKEWSRGLMENLGYQHVEAFDDGFPKGKWDMVKVHWCKRKEDLRG